MPHDPAKRVARSRPRAHLVVLAGAIGLASAVGCGASTDEPSATTASSAGGHGGGSVAHGGGGATSACAAGVACFDGAWPDAGDPGSCRRGTTTCDESGHATCAGEVLPRATTDCEASDVDCDGVADCAGTARWGDVFPAPSSSSSIVNGAAFADDGTLWVTGTADRTSLFGETPVGLGDAFIARLDAAGRVLFAMMPGRTPNVQANEGLAIAASADGKQVLAVGAFQGSAAFGPSATLSAPGTRAGYAMWLEGGEVRGARSFVSSTAASVVVATSAAFPAGVASPKQKTVGLTFAGELQIGGEIVKSNSSRDGLVVVLEGDAARATQLAGGLVDLTAVAMAADGTVWATGSFMTSITLGAGGPASLALWTDFPQDRAVLNLAPRKLDATSRKASYVA